jgi:exosortase
MSWVRAPLQRDLTGFMDETIDITAGANESARQNWHVWLRVGLLGGLVLILYHQILASLAHQWWTDPNYSHGLIVPFFCAWVIWKKRMRIVEAPLRPSWWGLVVTAGALGTLLLGVLGAELFLSRTSLLLLIAGLAVQFRGWRFFREILFPWALLFFTVPLPAIIFNQIALPLQFVASRLAGGMLGLLGVAVLREGNVIQLASITLDVAEACSGLRYLISLITFAVMYGYALERRAWARVFLLLAAIPIAVFANGIRIMGSGILGQYWNPDKAEGFFHLFSGGLIFVISLGSLVMLHAVLSLFDRRMRAENS